MTEKFTRVAVYGSLKKGFANNFLLQNAKYEGQFTTEPKFTMLNMGGAYPAVVKGGTTPILCEVYSEVDERTLRALDSLESFDRANPDKSYYLREVIETSFGKSWVYYLNTRLEVLSSGDWQIKPKRLTAKKKK